MIISHKSKELFLNFSLHFWNLHQFLSILKKKGKSHSFKYFGYYWLRNRRLLKCLKCLFSGNPSEVNVSSGSKHCWKMHGTTFYTTFPLTWDKLSWKSLLLVRSELFGLLLNTLRPMTCILAKICRTSRNKFKCRHLNNQKLFHAFSLHFWNLNQIIA